MSTWDHKSEWRKRGEGFMVTVSRHDVEVPDHKYDYYFGTGPHRWAVYAYIYPSHPMFGDFIPDGDMWQDAANRLNLHSGPSLFITHRADPKDREKITSFQIGADYNHLHDGHYTILNDDSFRDSSISSDADDLFALLSHAQEQSA